MGWAYQYRLGGMFKGSTESFIAAHCRGKSYLMMCQKLLEQHEHQRDESSDHKDDQRSARDRLGSQLQTRDPFHLAVSACNNNREHR